MKTILHIGFPKTATSTLQEQYFPMAPSIHYLPAGVAYARTDIERAAIGETFHVLSRDVINYDGALAAEAFAAFLGEADPKRHKVALISQERFAAPAATNWRGDRAVIVERLKALFPDAKVIIAVRNQLSMVHSQYVNRNAKSASYKPLNEWLHDFLDDPQRSFAFEFRYDQLVNLYMDAFGSENVHVMLFEEFVHDRPKFTDQLAAFIGIPADEFLVHNRTDRNANPTKSARSLRYAQFRNKFLPGVALSRLVPRMLTNAVQKYIGGGERARVEFSAEWKTRIVNQYADGNARLAQLIGEERLRQHGYPLPEAAPALGSGQRDD